MSDADEAAPGAWMDRMGLGRQRCVVVAEIGINHNGDLDIAKQLVAAAAAAGADFAKFQKRTPDRATPAAQRNLPRETPWGVLSYLEYRRKVEFDGAAYDELRRTCEAHDIGWFASAWDPEAVDFLEIYDPPFHKVPSAAVTDLELLDRVAETSRPVILSTGMSTLDEIGAAVDRLDHSKLVLLHTHSSYPAPPSELNLRVIETLRDAFRVPVGYSGHETGLATTLAAVALGACMIERHITLDRSMWGSDQAASVEPHGLARLVRDIRVIEDALGDGEKCVWPSELSARQRLRRVPGSSSSRR